MRIIIAVLINLIILGGLALYMNHRDAKAIVHDAPVPTQTALGSYTLEITPALRPRLIRSRFPQTNPRFLW